MIPVNNIHELADYMKRVILLDTDHPETLSQSDQEFIKIIDEFPDAKFLEEAHFDLLLQKIQDHNKASS